MHPFKIFIFAFLILALSLIYRWQKMQAGSLQITPLEVALNEPSDSVSFSEKTDSSRNIAIDTMHTFFDYLPDSSLNGFIGKLKFAKDSVVRMVFFGDSQLEGDFFTKPVRDSFQQVYGGSGIGYMPADMYFNTTEKVAVITSDFEKHVVHFGTDDSVQYGLYGRYFAPTKSIADVTIKNRDEMHRYKKLRILYSGSAHLTTNYDDKENIYELSSHDVSELEISFMNTPSELKLRFTVEEHLKLYGFLLDPGNGVVVDHVPFRGNLNLMLNNFEEESLRQMAGFVKPALVALQFGLNVIPDVRNDYSSYRVALERDIQLLKKYLPGISVVVIGAPDMAHKENGEMQVYKNIDLIVESQKEAAINQKVAFWDMRKAMGGNGSVINWVDEDLARTDYAHLNNRGAEKVAKLFTKDLFTVIQQNQKMNGGITEK